MNVHRLRAYDDAPARLAVPPVEAEQPPAALEQAPRWPWLQIVRLRLGTIFWLVSAAMAVASYAALRTPSIYTASTSVMIDAGQAKHDTEGQSVGLANEIQILTSTPFAERVIKKLNLQRDEEFAGPKPSSGILAMLTSLVGLRERSASTRLPQGIVDPLIRQRFGARLVVEPQGRSSVVRISFSSTGPAKSATIANAIAAEYLGAQPGVSEAQPDPERLTQLAAQARSDEDAVAQYRNSSSFGESAPPPVASDVSQEVSAARAEIATLEAKFRKYNTLYHSGGVGAVATVISSTKLTQLRKQQADLASQEAALSTKYGDKHPQMIALKGEREEIDKKIDEEVRRVIQALGGQVNAARAHLAQLEQSQSVAPPAAMPAASDEPLRELERRASSSRAAYEAALNGDNTASDSAPPSRGRRIEPAAVPRVATAPNRPLILGGVFGGALLVAVLLALWLERPRNAFRSAREIEGNTQVANLAVVPSARRGKGTVERVVRKPRSSFAEAIRALHAGIQLLRTGQPKVLLVTSSVANEGKTSIAVALGRLVARSGGRVILIDCDLRHPSIGAQLAGCDVEAGLVDVLTGKVDLATILRRDPLSPLEFLPVARPCANPSEILSSQALQNLIEVLRLHYDLVILDAAPVLPVADTRLLSRLADKAIYVVEWNKTPREAVLSGVALLRNAGTEVAGTVLNKTDMRRHAIFGYGFAAASDRYGNRYYAE